MIWATIVDSLVQGFLVKRINNLLVKLTIKLVHLYFIPYYITILYPILDSNKLMTYFI